MFVQNAWYVAAWDREVGETPLARTFLNQPVVLYRRGDGRPAALADRCCHRSLPLSCGKVIGNDLECGYHGLAFAPDGACVRVPGQTRVPPGAHVRAYPVVERWRLLWIWLGDPALADPTRIMDFHWLDDPAWRARGTRLDVACDYRNLIDNLLDLTHLAYVHRSTLGNAAVAEAAEVTTERQGDRVRVTRWMMDRPPPPMYLKIRPFEGNIDRWQIIEFTPPGFVTLDIGGADAGTGARQGDRRRGFERMSLNAITPATEKSLHYFWADAHNFRIDEPTVTDLLFCQVLEAFTEDKAILEAQQVSIDRGLAGEQVDTNQDGAGLQARRILDRLIAEEAAVSAYRAAV
jgi:vanillate O-demethylase monooxygenase subunit